MIAPAVTPTPDGIMDPLPKALAVHADEKWQAFCAAVKAAAGDYPPTDVLPPELRRVFAFSDFVAQNCIRHPGLPFDLVADGALEAPRPSGFCRQWLHEHFEGVTDASDAGRILRRFRRYEMVRIAWRDLAGRATLAETVADLSGFADACIQAALDFTYREQCRDYGSPQARGRSGRQLVVIGMGKLGGQELNFSSDVDLVFAYPEDGATGGGPTSVSHADFFTRLARQLLHLIGSPTADGALFRTDMRLRPYGESGPIVMSFDAMEAYYQRQGREWERYAWIKARVVAGDVDAGEKFLKRLTPFVYRRYLDYGVFESLRLMKRQIALEEQRKGIENNIKLGPGGIREIEFFGQVFQLIRGGVEPVLQQRQILKVLQILQDEGYIPPAVHDDLRSAYLFLRNTEHRLQEFDDRQTHLLPADPPARARLAAAMGFDGWASFFRALTGHVSRVHRHFNRLLEAREGDATTDLVLQQLEGLWQGLAGRGESRRILSDAGLENPEEVLEHLAHLKSDSATRALSNEGRERLDKLVPLVLREAGKSGQLSSGFHRIIELVKTVERRTCYLALLTENPTALTHLMRLADASPWIVSLMTRHPVLLDELLDPRTLYAPPQKSEMAADLAKRLKRLPPDDLERQIEELCVFKQGTMLRVAAADVTGSLPLMKVSDRLTDLAETVLAEVIELAWRHLVNRHGAPGAGQSARTGERGFSVVAYGKLGGLELGYDSDLDLVFLYASDSGRAGQGDRSFTDAQFYARLGQRVVHILTAHTAAGFLYETDMRLRPSGSAGLLVSHIDAFREYQLEKAWTWEYQALIRARVVSGDAHLAERFDKIRFEALVRPRDPNKLQSEVAQMRGRLRREHLDPQDQRFDLKQGVGGMVDIEFLVQYLVLLHACQYPDLVRWTDNVRLLETLADVGVLDEATANFLTEAYLYYRQTVHRLSLRESEPRVPTAECGELPERVVAVWQRFFV